MASVGEVPGDSEPVDINQRSTAAEYPHTSYILALAEGLLLAINPRHRMPLSTTVVEGVPNIRTEISAPQGVNTYTFSYTKLQTISESFVISIAYVYMQET